MEGEKVKDILKVIGVRDVIKHEARSGAHFRHQFMSNYNKQFGHFPKIIDTIDEDNWFGCIINNGDENMLISLCDGFPTIIGSLKVMTEIESLTFNGKHYLVPEYSGEDVFVFKTRQGNLRGKIGNDYINNQSVLDELGVAEKIKNLSNEYNCIVFGVVYDKEFIAKEIMDLNHNTIYTKEIADKIFNAFGLKTEMSIRIWQVDNMLNRYGGIVAKVYHEGELFRYKLKGNGIDKSKIREQVFSTLNQNLAKIGSLSIPDLYLFINRNGEFYKYEKETIIEYIAEWKESLKHISAEDIFKSYNTK